MKKQLHIGDGIVITSDRRGRLQCREGEIELLDADRKGHFWCFGTTRVGKTRLLENMIEEDIRKGYSVVVLDPKNDQDLFSKITQIAIETGRTEDLMLLTPIFPEHSITINPLEYYAMPEELVAHIVAGVEIGKEPFFFNVAYEVSLMIVQSTLQLMEADETKKDKKLTFEDVKNAANQVNLEELQQQIGSIQTERAQKLAADLKRVAESDPAYYSKISTSLRTTLMELTQGNVGRILGCTRGNKVIERLQERKGIIFVVQTGSLLTDDAAHAVSKVIISMFKSFIGRIFSSQDMVLSPPLMLFADEAQNVLFHGIEDLFAKAGGAGFWLHGFSQSINQIYAAMPSVEQGKSIMDNINTKIYMKAPDLETSKYVSDGFGEVKRFAPILTVNGHVNVREAKELMITPQNIMDLKVREFFMVTYKGKYRGYVRDVSEQLLKIKYPKITTVGEKEKSPSETKERKNEKNSMEYDVWKSSLAGVLVALLVYLLGISGKANIAIMIAGGMLPFLFNLMADNLKLKNNTLRGFGKWPLLAGLTIPFKPFFGAGWFISIVLQMLMGGTIPLLNPAKRIKVEFPSLVKYVIPFMGLFTILLTCLKFTNHLSPVYTILSFLIAVTYSFIHVSAKPYVISSIINNKHLTKYMPATVQKELKVTVLLERIAVIWQGNINKPEIAEPMQIELSDIADVSWAKDTPKEEKPQPISFEIVRMQQFWAQNINIKSIPAHSKNVIADLLKLLEGNSSCPSVVGRPDGKSDENATYDVVAKVPLWEHSLNVADEIILAADKIPNKDKHIIAALAHDIGKIRGLGLTNYYRARHVEDSLGMLGQIQSFEALNKSLKKDIEQAIYHHHKSSGSQNPLHKYLVDADSAARKKEYALHMPQSNVHAAPSVHIEKDANVTTKKENRSILYADLEGPEQNFKNREPLETDISWLDTRELMNELAPQVNTVVKNMYQAFSMSNGIVYCMVDLIRDAAAKLARQTGNIEFDINNNQERRQDLLISIVNKLRDTNILVDGAIKKGYFMAKYKVHYKSGESVNGMYIPLNSEYLGDIEELESRKIGHLKVSDITKVELDFTKNQE